MNKRGFTLIEVLIVVIILGILATLAIPQFTNMVKRARVSEAWSALGAVRTSQAVYWMEHETYADDIDDLDVDDVIGDFTVSIDSGGADFVARAVGADDAADIVAMINNDGEKGYTLEFSVDGDPALS